MHPSEATDRSFLELENLDACPLCGSARFVPAFEPDVAQCAACGVYFRNPRPTQAEIQRSYDFGSNYAEWQKDETSRRAMWLRRLALIRPFNHAGRLLDIGAGDGYFLDIAKAGGFETFGTELSLTGAEYAKGRGHQLLIGQLKEIDFKELKFDVVTIWHVLEHLPNPGEALAIISALLKPDGILALAVPKRRESPLQTSSSRRARRKPAGTPRLVERNPSHAFPAGHSAKGSLPGGPPAAPLRGR
jgi:SAM-dependent methyltransferase